MKFKVLIALTALALLAGSAPNAAAWSPGRGVRGSGDLETRSFDLERIDAVRIEGGFDLDIRFADRQRVDVTIDDNLWDNLVAEVEDGTLVLDWKKDCRPDGACTVALVLRDLKEIRIDGAGDVEVADFHGDSFVFDCRGAGNLDIAGEVDRLAIDIRGAGDVNARDLKAVSVDVSIAGAGDAEVHASRSLKGRITGVGNLDYWGDPDDKDTRVSGIGGIDGH
ncbi:MAG: head GIN domain-containing protein [Candidatus Krumholzibacteriia bacterium]